MCASLQMLLLWKAQPTFLCTIYLFCKYYLFLIQIALPA